MGIGEYTRTEIRITGKQYNKLQVNQHVFIYYLPDNPEEVMLAEDVE
jgi:hypothetical protein